jgi:hypothetical protein
VQLSREAMVDINGKRAIKAGMMKNLPEKSLMQRIDGRSCSTHVACVKPFTAKGSLKN